jgi:hypothetical protein
MRYKIMSINPIDHKPTTTFDVAINAEPLGATATNQFKISLSSNGVRLGWLGQNGDGWAILVTDLAQALTLELYPYNNINYYRIKGTDRYMSVSDRAYIGFYNWVGARGWTKNGTHLESNYNGQNLSFYSTDDGYLYAWNKYTILDVNFEQV